MNGRRERSEGAGDSTATTSEGNTEGTTLAFERFLDFGSVVQPTVGLTFEQDDPSEGCRDSLFQLNTAWLDVDAPPASRTTWVLRSPSATKRAEFPYSSTPSRQLLEEPARHTLSPLATPSRLSPATVASRPPLPFGSRCPAAPFTPQHLPRHPKPAVGYEAKGGGGGGGEVRGQRSGL